MLVIAAVLISALVTAVLVVVVLRMLGGSSVAEARREAETIRREAKIEAREEAVRLRQEVEREVAEQRGRMHEDRGAGPGQRGRGRAQAAGRRAARARPLGPRGPRQGAPGGPQGGEAARARGARARRRHDRQRGEDASARSVRGARAPRPRAPGAPARRGGPGRGEAPRQEPRRRRVAARCRKPCIRDHVLADRAPVRRHERPDHRPRGTEHPHARAPDRSGRDRRRHASGGRALVLRPDPPRDREDDAPQARRGRPHPAGADRGDVLPVQGRDRRAHPPGRRAGRLRGERGRVPRGGRQAPRPAQLPHELRPERPQAHARGRPPRPG